ncbi:beta strand repeat-containing protein [Luteolibacter sp. Populi]|uniref:beta strand repeat-containing protein n=1 Tax=Luteolibacter sp. Populi TaxID=3230487 RepID=UPI003465986B
MAEAVAGIFRRLIDRAVEGRGAVTNPKTAQVKPTIPNTRRSLLETALGCLLVSSASAATLYWDGPTAGWDAVANWSTAAGATTPNPAAVPGAADDVIFNIDPVDGATTVNLNNAQSARGLSFNNTGTTLLQAGGTNRILTLGAGGMTVDAAAGAVTIGSGTTGQSVNLSLAASQTWTNNSTNPLVIANTFTSAAGVNVIKSGTGTVWFNNQLNTSNITGTLDVQAGRFLMSGDITVGGLSGAGTVESGGPNSKWFFVNQNVNTVYSGAILNLSPTVKLGLVKRGTGSLGLSGASSTDLDRFAVEGGSVALTGGSIGTTGAADIAAAGTGVYGALSVSAGTFTSGSWLVVGGSGNRGVLNQSGGTITVNTNRITIGAGNNASIGVATLSGGNFTSALGAFVGENGTGTLNISGSANVTLGNTQFAGNAVSLAGNINLNGGTLGTNSVTKGNSTATGVYRFNFNGGTLKATAAGTLMADLALTTAYVNGNSTIDNNGFVVSMTEPLLAPTGDGLASIPVIAGGTGYIDTPIVQITGGGGTGATAIANVSGGAVTGITITNRGVDYTSAPLITLLGGTGTGAVTGTPTLAANTSGGMTFTGSGTTRLGSPGTFTGPVAVSQGKLGIAGPFANTLTVASGAGLEVFDPLGSPSILTVPSLSLPTGSTVDLDVSGFAGTNDTIEVSTPSGLTLGNVGIRLYEDGTTNDFTGTGTYILFKYSGTLNGGTAGLSVANPVLGYNYVFSAAAGEVRVAISFTDSDGDQMPNLWETANGLDPNDPDDATGTITFPPTVTPFNLDGDFSTNLEEFQNGTNPNSAAADDLNTDNDGLLDSWEVTNFTNITTVTGAGDYDGDLATNADEFYVDTNVKGASTVNNFDWPDSDFDLINDAWEVKYFGVITAKDGTVDSDSDGFTDMEEFTALSHPMDAAWTPVKAQLIHRWDFNGNFNDSVSGIAGVTNSTATIVDPNGATASAAVTPGASDVLLTGGASATSDYVQLGSNLLTGRATAVSIELYASQVAVQTYARIFDFGSAETDSTYMSWSVGTNNGAQRQEWRDYLTQGVDTNAPPPYALNTEFHIVWTFEPGAGAGGLNRVTFYAAPTDASDLGVMRGSFNTINNFVNLADTIDALGHSFYAGDNVANARYNDVRIWHGALTEDEREALHDAGSGTTLATDSEPDGLLDAWEIANFGGIGVTTGSVDSDGDGFTNAEEQDGHSIPNGPGGLASTPDDRDGDALSDSWEFTNFANLAQIGTGDADGDLATNEQEETAGTNPGSAASWPDTDGDSLKDAWELLYFGDLDANNDGDNTNDGGFDSDSDTYTNLQEFTIGTNPASALSLPASVVVLPATGTDAGSDISSAKTYSHAIDFGLTTAAVAVNGVSFHQASVPPTGNDAAGTDNDRWDSIDNTGGRNGAFTLTKSLANDWPQGTGPGPSVTIAADGNVGAMLDDFVHINGSVVGSTQTVTLGGLTAGTRYSTRVYYRNWSLAFNRNTTITFNGDGNNVAQLFNQDESAAPQAAYVKFDFTANDSDLTIVFAVGNATHSWHQYLVTNEVVGGGPGDGDSDGLPDAYEVTNFGGTTAQTGASDADKDGSDNRTEYLLGLGPNNGSQFFKATQTGTPGAGITLTWPAQNGLSFIVQRSETLTGVWTQLGGTIVAGGATATYTDIAPPPGKAFYRIQLTTP